MTTPTVLAPATDDGPPKPDVQFGLELVTPTVAERMLTRNTHNRGARSRVIASYAEDMAAGDWRFTGEAITFDKAGRLLDGQHRLHAIIQADVAVWLLVVRGLDSEAQEDTDRGVPRKFSDVLKLRGEENVQALAALVRLAWTWGQGQRRNLTSSTPTVAQLTRFMEKHPELPEYATNEQRRVAEGSRLPPSAVSLLWWVFAGIDQEDADHFFRRLAEDTGHEKGQPIYELRRTIQNARNSAHGELNRDWCVAITCKAWNAFRDGSTVGLYRWSPGGARPEAFPEPR